VFNPRINFDRNTYPIAEYSPAQGQPGGPAAIPAKNHILSGTQN
jgi:hypothetical protein